MSTGQPRNMLYFGDCLSVLAGLPLYSVDLIYLDPPFNSNRQYNSIYKDETGRPLPEQVDAFCDMWTLDPETERAIRYMPVLMRENGIDDATTEFWRLWMNALRDTNPRLLAYLSYMVQRLLQMRTILKPTGTLYLHCDPTTSHYVKVMMDAIFGHTNFRNEIVWCYAGGGQPRSDFPRKHDIILRYSRGETYTFNRDAVRVPYDSDYQSTSFAGADTRAPGRTYGRHPDGKVVEDWWRNISRPYGDERIGYATQKPLALLERIIAASSNPGDVVLDPFAGCATTLEAAHKLGRRWIGVDIAIHAVNRVARQRLVERLGLVEGSDFEITGIPETAEGALDLWTRDKHQFQTWAIEVADGFATKRRSGDGGIDGRLYFDVPGERALQSMVIEVKGGRTVNIAVAARRAGTGK